MSDLTPEQLKLVNLFNEKDRMHQELNQLGDRKLKLAQKAYDFQLIYATLVEKKLRFMELDGVNIDQGRLKQGLDPGVIERHLFAPDLVNKNDGQREPGWDDLPEKEQVDNEVDDWAEGAPSIFEQDD